MAKKASKLDVQKYAAKSNPPTIIDLDDLEEPINILCHGDTGAGKNRLWGHLLANGKGIVLRIEPGAISMKQAGIKGVKVIVCHTWPDIVGAYEYLRDNPDLYEWIMIDSITKAQSMCIRHIMQVVVLANPERDPHIPAQGDHFKWQLSIKQMVEDFNDLQANTIWLSRSMVRENPDGDDIIVPSIEGKDYGMSAWVSGEMSLLCYLRKVDKGSGEVVRRLYTNEHPVYWCKDWYDALPHVVEFKEDKGVAEKLINLITSSGNSAAAAKKEPAKKAATKKKGK
jgi:hypothetical protein